MFLIGLCILFFFSYKNVQSEYNKIIYFFLRSLSLDFYTQKSCSFQASIIQILYSAYDNTHIMLKAFWIQQKKSNTQWILSILICKSVYQFIQITDNLDRLPVNFYISIHFYLQKKAGLCIRTFLFELFPINFCIYDLASSFIAFFWKW